MIEGCDCLRCQAKILAGEYSISWMQALMLLAVATCNQEAITGAQLLRQGYAWSLVQYLLISGMLRPARVIN